MGYTMQATVASWLMTTLTPSPLLVASVQAASTTPTLLFGLVAGSLADIADRRRVILITQVAMFAVVSLLGAAAIAGIIGPAALLLMTFLIGCGFSFYHPAQQASVNDLVSREELPVAIALSGVAFNTARAAGPALAGALVAWISPGAALLFSALCFTLMFSAVWRWKHAEYKLPGVPERLLTGVQSGMRFAWHSSAMRSSIVRGWSFAIAASAFWSLLPLIARDALGLGSGGFGLLSAGFGIGAIVGAWTIPQALRRFSLNNVVLFGSAAWAAALITLGFSTGPWVAFCAALTAGGAWVSALGSISAGVQTSAPSWVRARAVSMHLVSTQASLAVGSVIWGAIAAAYGLRESVVMSAAVMLLLNGLTYRFRAEIGSEAEVLPSISVPELTIPVEPMPDDGPVLIQIEYRVARSQFRAFLHALEAVGPTRRRNGATSWRVFRDVEDRERIVERYVVASWGDYLRHRARMTMADSDLQDQARRFQLDGVPIRVSRLIGINGNSASPKDVS